MYGYNYEVCFGVELFENCASYDVFKTNLKESFPKSNPETTTPIQFDKSFFWEEIEYGLNYRGDNSAGLILKETDKPKVEELQQKYVAFLKEFITESTEILSYPNDVGLPGYPVFWDYRFILFNEKDQCLFIYGSASD